MSEELEKAFKSSSMKFILHFLMVYNLPLKKHGFFLYAIHTRNVLNYNLQLQW